MAQTIKVPDDAGPYDVGLSIGRFPFDWELYDYTRTEAGWSRKRLAAGSNLLLVRLPAQSRAELAGHSLVWSVTLLDLDEETRTTELTVSLLGPGKKPSVVTASFDAVPERPHLFVTVEVIA